MSGKDDDSAFDSDKELSLVAAIATNPSRTTKSSGKKRPLSGQSSVAAAAQGRKSPQTTERKRLREQRRRADLGQRFTELTALLREIDPDFRDLNSQDSASPVASLDGSTLTRLDIITHAISTLRRIHTENQTRQSIIGQMTRGTGGQQLELQQSASAAGSSFRGYLSRSLMDYPGLLGQLPAQQPQVSGLASYLPTVQDQGYSIAAQALLAERVNIARRLALAQQIPNSTALSQLGQRRTEMDSFSLPERSLFGGGNPSIEACALSQHTTTASTMQQLQERLRNHSMPPIRAQHQESQHDETDSGSASSS